MSLRLALMIAWIGFGCAACANTVEGAAAFEASNAPATQAATLAPAGVSAKSDATPQERAVPSDLFILTNDQSELEGVVIDEGFASWYGDRYAGRPTASGEIFDPSELTAAHPSLPLPRLARVTRTDTGASVVVRVNDRGPFVAGRVVDVSEAAADLLGFTQTGLAPVQVEDLGPAAP